MDAILFDLDDTLCVYRRHGREVLTGAFEQVGVEPLFDIEDYYGVYEEYTGAADTVDAQRELCFRDLAEAAGGDTEVGQAVARVYAANRDHRDVLFSDGAEEAIRALSATYRLGMVTNGAPDMQSAKLEALGVRHEFETIVYAGHDTPAKPSPEPFHTALEALGVAPERTIHVGNSLDADVAGAKAAGLTAVWLRPPDASGEPVPRPDHTVASLAELVDEPWR